MTEYPAYGMEFIPLGEEVFIELVVRNNRGVHKVQRMISEETIIASTLGPRFCVAMEIRAMSDTMIENLFPTKEE